MTSPYARTGARLVDQGYSAAVNNNGQRNLMTPSEAHDSAYTRTPEHDEMVASIYEHLQEHGCPVGFNYHVKGATAQPSKPYQHSWVECEKMYTGQRSFFADIAIVQWADDKGTFKDGCRYSHHFLLEVKPKIYSAGAVLRQVKAQEALISEWCRELESREPGEAIGRSQRSAWSCVAPVFSAGDPLIAVFTRMAEVDQIYFTWSPDTGLVCPRPVRRISREDRSA